MEMKAERWEKRECEVRVHSGHSEARAWQSRRTPVPPR